MNLVTPEAGAKHELSFSTDRPLDWCQICDGWNYLLKKFVTFVKRPNSQAKAFKCSWKLPKFIYHSTWSFIERAQRPQKPKRPQAQKAQTPTSPKGPNDPKSQSRKFKVAQVYLSVILNNFYFLHLCCRWYVWFRSYWVYQRNVQKRTAAATAETAATTATT